MPTLWEKSLSRDDFQRRVGRLEQVAGVRLITLDDGVERGVRALEFRTGTGFIFEVLVDRALDIGRCEYAGKPVGYQSGVGFSGPWYYEPDGFGFLRSFGGGLLTTCGLDHALFQTEDSAAHYHYPPKQTEQYGLHGRISNRPARLRGYGEDWQGDDCILWAEGDVLQVSALGENLRLRRRIEARVGESRIIIRDKVTNLGYHPTPHMYLYHINIGFPVVADGAEILVPAHEIRPCGDYPVEGFTCLTAPIPNAEERVFEYEPLAEADNTVPIGIISPDYQIGFYECFKRDQLPHPFIWRMLGEGNYVVALEPSTNRVAGRLDARARGELIELQPGETRSYDLELGALTTPADINGFAQRVARLTA